MNGNSLPSEGLFNHARHSGCALNRAEIAGAGKVELGGAAKDFL
jgi:hypothetical protein